MIETIKYQFKDFYRRIYNIYRWLPILWNQHDFDYKYAIIAFQFQLGNIAKFMESDDAMSLESKETAKQIRDIIDRMQRVYDDEYALSYIDTMTELYGDFDFEFIPIDEKIIDPLTGKEQLCYKMEKRYNMPYNEDEIANIEIHSEELRAAAAACQESEHSRLWNDIDKNIRNWWD